MGDGVKPISPSFYLTKEGEMTLGKYLIENKIISPEILRIALDIQKISKKRLGRILVSLGAITYQELVSYLSKYNPDALPEERSIFSTIKWEALREMNTIILSETPTELFIGTINPSSKDYLEKTLKKKVYIKPVDLNVFLKELHSIEQKTQTVNVDNPNDLLDFFIKQTVNRHGSDIHIEVLNDVCVVRFRIDGVLYPETVLEKDIGDMLIARIKGLANLDMAEKKYPQDGAFTYPVSSSKTIDIRVSSMPTITGESVVLRILDKDSVMIKLEELGAKHMDKWKEAITSLNGIILVTGPTGSGKTTTLYSTLLELDRLKKNIITIEDPVEYQFSFIRQVQVNRILNLDFATFLKHTLRQDPDVILVGEIRDLETAKTAIRAAETGHLVFATLHSNDIMSTFVRLKDLGISYSDIKYTLRCVMSQLLIRKTCKACGGKGCQLCGYTGYRGRMLISEIVNVTPDIVDKVANGESLEYETLYENALDLANKGITDKEEIERLFGIGKGKEV